MSLSTKVMTFRKNNNKKKEFLLSCNNWKWQRPSEYLRQTVQIKWCFWRFEAAFIQQWSLIDQKQMHQEEMCRVNNGPHDPPNPLLCFPEKAPFLSSFINNVKVIVTLQNPIVYRAKGRNKVLRYLFLLLKRSAFTELFCVGMCFFFHMCHKNKINPWQKTSSLTYKKLDWISLECFTQDFPNDAHNHWVKIQQTSANVTSVYKEYRFSIDTVDPLSNTAYETETTQSNLRNRKL